MPEARLTVRCSALTLGCAMMVACSGHDPEEPPFARLPGDDLASAPSPLSARIDTHSPTDTYTPIGLALEVDGDVARTVTVRTGQRFFIDQIDLRTAIDRVVDEGIDGLRVDSDFSSLTWHGVHLADHEFVGLANADGTFTDRRFFRGAAWMEQSSRFVVTQVDEHGHATALPWVLSAGSDDQRRATDSFFVRRFRAIQWVFDCPSKESCDGATRFQEEALVELRNARLPAYPVRMSHRTAALELRWSLDPLRVHRIPVTQVADPELDYGFVIDVDPLTPAGPGGVYAPGTDITFRLTLLDGSGNRLHPEGSLPTYDEVVLREANAAGIQYYRAFFDPTTTYYRRKHRERMLMAQIIGPAQSIGPIRSIIDLDAFLGPDDAQVTGTPERDGVFAEFQTFPPAPALFGGAFDPVHAGWFAPVSDTFTFHLPDDAEAGTYLVTVKGRRLYLGQDIPDTRTIEIQVGTAAHTEAALTTGPCNTCHSGTSGLDVVLHGNDNRAACAGCHVPLGFELEGPIVVRTHFLHSRSDRFDAPLERCSSCHLTNEGIHRTSKAACLSCHDSYPASHVAEFGPIESMYIGGGRESFEQCSDSCHTTHPSSGL